MATVTIYNNNVSLGFNDENRQTTFSLFEFGDKIGFLGEQVGEVNPSSHTFEQDGQGHLNLSAAETKGNPNILMMEKKSDKIYDLLDPQGASNPTAGVEVTEMSLSF